MSAIRTREWHMFLGVREPDAASAEVTRLLHRVDDAFDALNYVLRALAGCPDGELEDSLRIGRKTLDESIAALQEAAAQLRRDDHDAA